MSIGFTTKDTVAAHPLIYLCMDKISYYNISVPYQSNYMVYNSFSDSLICLTLEEYEIIKERMRSLPDFEKEYPTLYRNLKEAGFIIDDYDELSYIRFNNRLCIFEDRTYHLTINPTLDCNLQCWYCSTEYANAIHNGGMSSETVEAIRNHISNLIMREKIPALHLDWFGGEPLMYYQDVIHPIAQFAIKLANEKDVSLTQHITTNAFLITERMIVDMKNLGINSFQIPLDGNEKHHNSIKFTDLKEGTFKKVIANINMLCEMIPDVNITLRINYDKKTLYGIEEIIPLITEKAKKRIQVDFQKVWQVDCSEKDKKQLIKMKELFRENGLESGYWAYSPKKFNRCYSDRLHHYAINYDGRVFKCTAQDYADDKVIGILRPDGNINWNDKRLSELFAHSTFDNERCLKCKALPICMGPCIIRIYEARKLNMPVPCVFDNTQFSLESYIIEKAKIRKLI